MHGHRFSLVELSLERVILWYAGLYFLISLGIHFAFVPIGDIGVESDFYGELVVAAKELLHHDFSVTSYPVKGPFYSFALIAVRLLVRDWYLSGVILNALSALASMLVAFKLLSRLFERNTAFLATIAMSLTCEYFTLAHKACSDMLFLLLCLISLNLLLTERFAWWRFVLGGMLGACAFLTRYVGVFLPLAAVLACVINPWGGSRRRAVTGGLAYVAAFLALCAPWFIKSVHETGSLLYTGSVKIVTAEIYRDRTASDMPEGGFDSIVGLLAHDPARFFVHYVRNIPLHLWKDIYNFLGIEVGILMVFGVARMFFRRPTRIQYAFFSCFALYFLVCCLVYYLMRYFLLLSTAYFALAFSFVVNLGDTPRFFSRFSRDSGKTEKKLKGNGKSARPGEEAGGKAPTTKSSLARIVTAAILCVVLLFQVAGIVASERYYYKQRPLYLLDAARFLKGYVERQHGNEKDIVMARKPHVAYYAHLTYQQYPQSFSLPRGILAYARSRHIRYLVYSSIERRYFEKEEGWRLLGTLDGVKVIYSADSTTIYQVNP